MTFLVLIVVVEIPDLCWLALTWGRCEAERNLVHVVEPGRVRQAFHLVPVQNKTVSRLRRLEKKILGVYGKPFFPVNLVIVFEVLGFFLT